MGIPATFDVEIPGIGVFRFRKRTPRLQLRIAAAIGDILDGNVRWDGPTSRASQIAQLEILLEKAPEGWSLDDMDPLDDSTWDTVERVTGVLREAEARFRKGIT